MKPTPAAIARIDAEDDRYNPRLEATQCFEFKRERDDKTADRDYQPNGDGPDVDRACLSDPKRNCDQRGDREG